MCSLPLGGPSRSRPGWFEDNLAVADDEGHGQLLMDGLRFTLTPRARAEQVRNRSDSVDRAAAVGDMLDQPRDSGRVASCGGRPPAEADGTLRRGARHPQGPTGRDSLRSWAPSAKGLRASLGDATPR